MLIRSTRCYLGRDELQVAARHHRPEIRDLVVQEFLDRRKRLKVVAETFLSDELRHALSITPDTLLAFDAFITYRSLNESLATVNEFHDDYKYPWSVYDSTGDNLELSDRLWDAGFRDVDEVHETGETCLTRIGWTALARRFVGLLRKANWLVSKGADINHKISGSSALHILGHTVGRAIHLAKGTEEFASQLSQMSEDCKRLLRRIIGDHIRDNCCCPYSLSGCSGFTRLLGGLFPTRSEEGMDELVKRLAAMLEILFDPEEFHTRVYITREVVSCVLRFITSRSLGISHTCSHERYRAYEPDEIAEIQDEEKDLILLSQQLVEKFLAKYNEQFLALPDFLTGFWWTHMNEVLSTCEPASAEEIGRILETGVILHR
ncbi:hypothetical protein CNMCM8980_005100 [Aspergillus fumigatiaffinis]|uniref:Uncharacterized protein n=1 Tax=Aspergillus fumigatiaffinis TaxID=340414 RepID=A0A8H4GZ43_9EURO|nr:hypothetical protein CNMCM6805_000263 [Aspergillus fumigatiaffinis]KAF4248745.1 hypothetical protein CNMCM8980_005100 [Aspergillus fumigatiaffinis]